ncbi:MAG: HAMP domain-containing sensor histidine kinase [Bacteroidales bacterium]|nr:HAMP domain-containing sensor histidine kinase [Bacteroidales bacterium]
MINQRSKNIFYWLFLSVSILTVGMFLYFSNGLVRSLEQEENAKMQLWADAYQKIFASGNDEDLSFEWQVIGSNTTIPVFYTEMDHTVLGFRNIELPLYMQLSGAQQQADTLQYLEHLIPRLEAKGNLFVIDITPSTKQLLYYEDSILLQRLYYYPYVQVLVVIVLLCLLYFMFRSMRTAEQNRVWVGLSKETAHQLGTPIQSLMGWIEYLRSLEQPELKDITYEIDKDINRLRVVADRFSKIGSEPVLKTEDLRPIVQQVVEYMQKRVSQHIHFELQMPDEPLTASVCAPLLSWVIENLCKNAVDASDKPESFIRIRLFEDATRKGFSAHPVLEIEDNGKGIPSHKFKTVFQAGYTTKTRGWGLGLALVKRIVNDYHRGHIFVKRSELGKGTVFRVEL